MIIYKNSDKDTLKFTVDLLNSFPFSEEYGSNVDVKYLDELYLVYAPYSEIDVDEFANTICWNISTFKKFIKSCVCKGSG